ncbi:MAG: hypothetical protein JOY96_03680 [Verrucomicrobia bacterium]|nr:hypothetical protein [Verrucomicrobiota bacterium]MBV9671701.1 hypothetical protein [Verrucomicrobiota bacterium]
MFETPDPFHPAVAYFPIVLILLGTLTSLLAIFTRKAALFTLFVLILAAGSAQYAVQTGAEAGEEVLQKDPGFRSFIEEHSLWGDRMRIVAAAAAVFALIGSSFQRSAGVRRILLLLTTVVASASSYCALKAAESGGKMVYQHAVGINVPSGSGSPSPTAAP